MSAFGWVMMGIAIWRGCVLIPGSFYRGLLGCLLTLALLYTYGVRVERREVQRA